MRIKKAIFSKQQVLEYFIYASLWVVVFLTPLFEGLRKSAEFDWLSTLKSDRFIIPFLLVFLIHDFSLSLTLRKKVGRWVHILVIAVCIGVAFFSSPFLKPADRHMPEREFAPPLKPTMEPPKGNFPPPREPHEKKIFGPLRLAPPMGDLLIVMFIIGFNTVVKLQFRSVKKLQRLEELERQHVETELAYLKSQISPHFFMNTLNNIHALIDVDSEKAKETVIELAKLMRFLLYESGQRVIPLAKEVTFLSNFVELMKLRYIDNVEIKMELPENIPSSILVPPLLLLPFLENAFKHGISYRKPSYVHFTLSISDGKLCCVVRNSNHGRGNNPNVGIGLDNVRKRLQILFDSNYQLNVNNTDAEFTVDLSLDLGDRNVNY